jgi:hypothetical protein
LKADAVRSSSLIQCPGPRGIDLTPVPVSPPRRSPELIGCARRSILARGDTSAGCGRCSCASSSRIFRPGGLARPGLPGDDPDTVVAVAAAMSLAARWLTGRSSRMGDPVVGGRVRGRVSMGGSEPTVPARRCLHNTRSPAPACQCGSPLSARHNSCSFR